ncbi:sugar transferase [Rhodobacter capsulatus]|uniref:Sugar transferase involved in LPS biosynthesis (Colanic, teichoic acid) n=1 Tax=Rhodobacter capsulatus TaxID=1061 RepID=A0A0Q0UCF7_RHOCA|nr:sugar transferase [Rhodobacter capsulatus]KQB11594.1 sugar transferase [Rhodobacter capsulatus]KQB11710.1 sugar transferase [Rhodobacter capsulatus]PZX28695.1 lipopolysaccharide/colanic/teichoic acid biosynthesis glycosyltransferase [Rhodobacter capsulatus]QNR62963.1 sugar transferase [Rhodobacter capsulatus]WER09047.1 sugar transferase [Rhodobacter capsulatus]
MSLTKRLFDIGFALLILPVIGLLGLLVLAALALTQGRPYFYAAERMKTPDTAFRLWKFRTMTVVATDAGVSGGDKAGRITPVGRLLRRFRLDELPQLWNILRGDISFVGPRPPLRSYVERFPGIYAEVLKSRPGVTGLASIHYHRHEEWLLARSRSAEETDRLYCRICIPAKAKLDLIYARHASVCLDLRLIGRTIARMIS